MTGCSSKPTEQEIAQQETYEANVSNAPEWTSQQKTFIEESRGVVIDEETNEEDEVVPILNSFSPGEEAVYKLASLTQEELLALDDLAKMEIFINGVIRDEYTVAAHTLYGESKVESFKKEFKDALMSDYDSRSWDEDRKKIKNIDVLGYYSIIGDGDVMRHHIDDIIAHLNRVYIKLIPKSDFSDRVSLRGQVYPVGLNRQLEALQDDAYEFTGVDATQNSNFLDDDDYKILNEYYREMLPGALRASNLSEEEEFVSDIGGFVKSEEGTWEPAIMEIFARNMVNLVFGVY